MEHVRIAAPAIDRPARHVCTLHLSLDGLATTTDLKGMSEAGARKALNKFRADNWTNKLATACIWNGVAYIDSWTGGIVFGPKDMRHPMERMAARAIRNGHSVALIDDRGTTHFNTEPMPATAAAWSAIR